MTDHIDLNIPDTAEERANHKLCASFVSELFIVKL